MIVVMHPWNWIFHAALAGFVLSAVLGYVLLRILPALQFRQIAYEDAPQTHQRKTGTPTMGGIAIAGALAFLWAVPDPLTRALMFLIFTCGAIGFLDDFLSIRRGKNLGLRSRTKFLATALIAIIFLRWIDGSTVIFPRDTLLHAGTWSLVAPHWVWLLLGIVAVTGTIHAVNLTDGLDGLATGTIVPPLFVFLFVAAQARDGVWMFVLAALIGGCAGFLLYNRHPAKMFMGDTGSLALGAALSGGAILTGEMLLLILVGGVFVAEALSVIVQVAYFKRTHKRIFRMSPLHHHFELGGWPETKVTTRFWLVSTILSALGLAVVR